MTTSTPQTLIQEHRELVSLPVIVTRLNEMINDPACSAADIAETLGQDAALAARLLKI
ncbi:MAG: HDOD domain-containing protein, partial [Pseudomonadota bacterium]